MLITPTIRDLMKNSTIYGHCVPCWKSRVLDGPTLLMRYGDRPWGPETKIKVVCSVCGSRDTSVFVSYSGAPHGEEAGSWLSGSDKKLLGRDG